MARVNDSTLFYVHMLCLSREDSIMLLGTLLSMMAYSDDELSQIFFGEVKEGAGADVRKSLQDLGRRIDDDWDSMLQKVSSLSN